MDSVQFQGLTNTDILKQQQQFGKNIFCAEKPRRLYHILWDIVKEPMFIMLLFACLIYILLAEFKEGIMMFVAMIVVAAISIYQEMKSSLALAALKKFTEPKVKVIRDGKEQIILSEDLVPGDVIVLEEGNRIPADATVLQQNDFSVNESILTGESVPVEKSDIANNELYQGTVINSGKCIARITAIGNQTKLGQLGKSIGNMTIAKTLLQHQIARFVKLMAIVGLAAFGVIWLVNYWESRDLLQSLLFGLTIAMSVIPEEIPVAFSSFMALGAYQMSKRNIIARQPVTIENLGAVSVICLDKTGTITENKMQVKAVYNFTTHQINILEKEISLPDSHVLRYARLASEEHPFDAMEKAIVDAYEKYYSTKSDEHLQMVHEYPLSGRPPMMTHVWSDGNQTIIAAKGAAERILKVCKLDNEKLTTVRKKIDEISNKGYRVIAVASAEYQGEYPQNQDDFNWKFEGLLGLSDPPKKNVANVFQDFYTAGIQIKMITGDYATTACNIASQVGIKNHQHYCTGDQVMNLSDNALKETVKNTDIFARMFPEAKLKVINAIKSNGDIVAMTGDGVNDGPALKSSHIGIAMGNKGTEIAKEAADLIIIDDDLEKMTVAIQQGRKIYNNLKKAIRYIISIHIPILLTASLPLLLGWKYPNIFTPIHVIFLELIMGPTCSVFYEREPEEKNIMKRVPRERKDSLFSHKELFVSIIQGLVITGGLLILYYYFMNNDYSLEYVRTIVFTTLIFSNIFLTFINRSFKEPFYRTVQYKNSLVPVLLLVSAFFLLTISLITPIRQVFQLTQITTLHYLLCIGVGFVSTAWLEVYKIFSLLANKSVKLM